MKDKPYPFIKNRYYKGKLLRTEDFECEQNYHVHKLNMLYFMVKELFVV